MIQRNALAKGAVLSFPGMEIEISSVLGQGSNAIVYKGSYEDGLTEHARHTVLVKELFPFHPKGLIYRNDNGKIVVDPEANELFLLHRQSFERGNKAHLKLLELFPDKVGGNVNTFELNGTLYTVLAESGGREIRTAEKPKTLKILTRRMLSLLDALSAFHESNLLHLDISPDNILLIGKGENERCMLIDYNSAFSPEELHCGKDAYFSVKQGFTAPEVVNKNLSTVSWSADLYSVAAVFFAMLMDRPLSLKETLSKNPPDVADAALLKDAPDTVVSQVKAILKKGLASLPARRYRAISEMREAFEELMRRIDMLGVTHAALWEAGKKSIQKLTRENPFYRYLTDDSAMFPVRLTDENGQTQTMDEFLDAFLSEEGESISVVSGGGMGKTTLLLKSALILSNAYSPVRPAQMYISLAGKKSGEKDFLIDEILKSLRFTADTVTYDGARHQLRALLSAPLKTKNGGSPALVLLLDGLNEATGDTALLYQEIRQLNKLPGLRMLIASRAEDQEIPFARIALSALTEMDVEEALKKRGLLKPENAQILALLKTPLMLSLFLRASEGSQLSVETEEDLLNAYISSLLQKEKEALGDDEGQKYRIEAAVGYVLCALARKAEKSGAISETEAYETVGRCRKTLLSKNLLRAFPMWIGHRKDIAMHSDDEFYGEIVHGILVHRMGLIVRANGNIRISHARIGEYLAKKQAENEKQIKKRKALRSATWAAALLLLLAGGSFTYNTWFKDYVVKVEIPKIPYDDAMAERCLTYATNGYNEYGALYEKMAELLEDALVYPDGYTPVSLPSEEEMNAFIDELNNLEEKEDSLEENSGEANGSWISLMLAKQKLNEPLEEMREIAEKYTQIMEYRTKKERELRGYKKQVCAYIDEMLQSGGEVVRWSQEPFDGETAKDLICFADDCSQLYDDFKIVYDIWVQNEKIQAYCPEYKEAFVNLVKADAIVAVQMYQVVCAPHEIGQDDIWQPERLKSIAAFSGKHSYFETMRSREKGQAAMQDLMNAEVRRQDALNALEKQIYQIELYLETGGTAND